MNFHAGPGQAAFFVYQDRVEYFAKGVFKRRHEATISMSDVTEVHVKKNTVFVETPQGSYEVDARMGNKEKAQQVKELIEARAQVYREDSLEALSEPVEEVPVQKGLGIPDQIRQLAELRDAGILSEDEFQAKKTELVNRM